MTIRIAPGLELPTDVVTQAIAILARRGAGKTYTAINAGELSRIERGRSCPSRDQARRILAAFDEAPT